ncbi:50S ribosomal protein L21e [Candidatus Bathyarchaeota archaeon]|jgi:large subunit ribosomal protein L21e|nr:50S ribosomal protein L21e [Candidatus Bathyarchaeota archaeon]MCJ7732426.1 50S ribosomal protein L21e [Candidatus Bathyarchaeota archaeon]TFH18573.1 MAG: 50S ribosomal protein L21e [Candidatus Bathyarchaeota archaeon]
MGNSSGIRRKSRSVLSKKVRDKGKIPLSRLLTKYDEGEKVVITIDSGIHKAMPHKRFQGKVATVVGQRGKAYILEIPQRKTVKTIITTAYHITKHQDA